MIKIYNVCQYCCDDISNIENYEKAIADSEIWDCHHRREISENKTAQQLMSEGKYWNVPSSELIFLTHVEHAALHGKGKSKGLGYKHTKLAKQKIGAAKKGLLWWNNGIKNVLREKCPPGFVRGRIKRKIPQNNKI